MEGTVILNSALISVEEYDPTFSEAVDLTAEMLRGLRSEKIGFSTAEVFNLKAEALRDKEITERENRGKEIMLNMLKSQLPLQDCVDLRGDDAINGSMQIQPLCPAGVIGCTYEKPRCAKGNCPLDYPPLKLFSDGHTVRYKRTPEPRYLSKRSRFTDRTSSINALPDS